jgi:hypothetical protein
MANATPDAGRAAADDEQLASFNQGAQHARNM